MNVITNNMRKDGYLELIKCVLVDGQFRTRGDAEKISLIDAVKKFTPNQKNSVVLKASPGTYIGLLSNNQCFVISNKNSKNNINWLIAKKPEFKSSIREVFLVKENYKAVTRTKV